MRKESGIIQSFAIFCQMIRTTINHQSSGKWKCSYDTGRIRVGYRGFVVVFSLGRSGVKWTLAAIMYWEGALEKVCVCVYCEETFKCMCIIMTHLSVCIWHKDIHAHICGQGYYKFGWKKLLRSHDASFSSSFFLYRLGLGDSSPVKSEPVRFFTVLKPYPAVSKI